MATLNDIKRKIDAVKKTSQITRAMNMVAAAKLRTAQADMEKFNPYAVKFKEVIGRLASGVDEDAAFALLEQREEVRKIEVVAFSADRGLCGSFNNNLMMTAKRFIEAKKAEGIEVSVTSVGRKGKSFFSRLYPVRAKYEGLLNKPSYEDANKLGQELIDLFESGEVDEVYVVYSEFVNIVKQIPTVVRLLPLTPEEKSEQSDSQTEYLFEPSHQELLNDLLPNSVFIRLLGYFFQTAVGEHAARMAAMDNATTNCKEMVRSLTLIYNKARQAAVTTELMDIVAGAEALRG